ncbi:TonB-linked outer membrane protein, SusC/RagA family [Filimonas lacunae]|uniref:TonB-linked outer membrane protein, SusC/RagA family n=1 Tax=Filimonas lacunae TaxID=477680 RepID=A0A173MNF4_9BACT|nr:TonB-dependent receptor [Filimonas lacunae]BAV08908.1 TonB-dependent receptor [Filimonas lacunae]SIS63821.1 TonB-linked outer membrane protein, SusC/RagA family [Filimonas lacunae]
MKKLLTCGRPLLPVAHYVTWVCSLLLLTAFTLPLWAQQQKITGTVIADKLPVADASVTVKGAATGVKTGTDGKFTITADVNATLVFSHVNFGIKELPLNGQTNVSVELTALAGSVGEVIVVGYSSQKKATVTGSISVVKGSDLVKSPAANVSNSFAGRFSGMTISNRTGEPGYDGSSILIRGLATTGNNDVLVVVDGVPGQIGGLERLNPNDIESVSVLKDASAAIYGSRAANGVILVTTKRGKSGKPAIAFSFNQGFSSPTRLPKMADAATYAAIRNEIAYYDNKAGGMNQIYTPDEIAKFANGSDPLNYPNTDWAKVTLKGAALQNQANISVSGGSEDVRYFLSAGTLYQDGLYKNGVTQYKQYSFRSNIDASITSDFKVGLYLSGRQEDRKYPLTGAGDIFRSIYRAYATIPAYYPNGLPSRGIEGNNPVMMVTDIGGTSSNPQSVFNGILKGSYNISAVKGLSVDGFMAMDKSWNFTKAFAKPYLLYNYDKTTNTYPSTIVGGSNNLANLNETQVNQSQLTYNIKLNYVRSFGSHAISAFAGYEQSELNRETFGATRQNFPSTETPELSQGGTAATDLNNSGSSYHFTRRSYIGKVGYNYSEKYLADVQMRIDGSSTFPSGSQYGYFPSVSAGWRVSKESFFHVPFVNDLKLRGSFGVLGNDNVGLFQYLDNYTFNSQVVQGGAIVPSINLTKLANTKIHWEEAKKLDIGVEAVLFNSINLELVYFKQMRSNILATRNASIPGVTGIVNPYIPDNTVFPLVPDENIGKINSSGIEATLGYNKKKGDWSYGITGNFTYAKSKIIFIDEAAGVLDYQKKTGRPLNTYLLYNAIGIFQSADDIAKYPHLSVAQPGDLIYQDINNDGVINADDQVRTKYGNVPEITYGLVMNGGYKNIDISIVLSGQARVSQYVLPEAGTVGNFYNSWAANRWSPTNPGGYYPRVDTRASSSVNGGLYENNFWLNNASFLRLKNIELGYNFTGRLLQKTRLQAARVYVNAFNVFTITKVKDYDPEGNNASGQFYPQQRIINLGVNVRF